MAGWPLVDFYANESTVAYVVPACTPIGTVVTISRLTGQLNPSTAGAQILAYSGDAAILTFLLAVDFADRTLVYAGDATNANTSVVSTGLTEGTDALALALAFAVATGAPGSFTVGDTSVAKGMPASPC